MIRTEKKVFIVFSSTSCSTLWLSQSQACAENKYDLCYLSLLWPLCYRYWYFTSDNCRVHFQNVFYSPINRLIFLKASMAVLSISPLLCSDDACAPRNTVAVATCSLTILCFYCPVPYSTLLCLAEPDESLPFETDRQHLCGLNQLISDLKLNVYSLHSIWYTINSRYLHLKE